MNLSEKVSKGVYAYGNLFILRKEPVIVYAPGHVGSMGMIKNLRDAGIYSFKVESFFRERKSASYFCKKHVVGAGRNAKIITLVRDPIALMASYFFGKANQNRLRMGAEGIAENDIEKLQTAFIHEVLETDRLDKHLYWYENDFAPSLGFNIFDHPFDTEKKWGIIDHQRFPTLALRIDMDDEEKGRVVVKFLDSSPIKITRENTRDKKDHASLYNAFKESLSLPEKILKKVYESNLATHFFSESERAELKQKWS